MYSKNMNYIVSNAVVNILLSCCYAYLHLSAPQNVHHRFVFDFRYCRIVVGQLRNSRRNMTHSINAIKLVISSAEKMNDHVSKQKN